MRIHPVLHGSLISEAQEKLQFFALFYGDNCMKRLPTGFQPDSFDLQVKKTQVKFC